MQFKEKYKFQSFVDFYQSLPDNERLMVDFLRDIILKELPYSTREKLTYNVPFYYGKRRICLIWPASVKGGGIKHGVLLGFCQGNSLKDVNNYLDRGTNKQIFYKIYHSIEDINVSAIISLLKEAVLLDRKF